MQEFEKAGDLRDKEVELKAKIDAIIADKTAEDKAETEGTGESGPIVEEADIANIVAQWTGIPIEKVSSDETNRLVNMEGVLHDRVVGQDEAVTAISRAIRRARVGLKNPARPIASFIFSGPTGVGKSELAKTLATYYFGSEEAMVRLDMSEYMERHTVSKLIGSPPGYVGYSEGAPPPALRTCTRARPACTPSVCPCRCRVSSSMHRAKRCKGCAWLICDVHGNTASLVVPASGRACRWAADRGGAPAAVHGGAV